MLYETEYPVKSNGEDKFASTTLWARDPEQAQRFIAQRQMGETFLGGDLKFLLFGASPLLPSQWYKKGDIPQALHAAMWLCMVAVKAKVVDAWDLLNDDGLLHNLAHLNMPQTEIDKQNPDYIARIRKQVGQQLKELEAKTPGFKIMPDLD